MTIYHNALNRVVEPYTWVEVDPEISFKNMGQVHTNQDFVEKANRDSSSSDEQIDTSDEMMEVGGDVDIHDKFIADCAAEA